MTAKDERAPTIVGGELQIGVMVRFIPAANYDHSAGFYDILMREITGTVVQIHDAHRWYRVEYIMGTKPGCIGHECFKF